MLPVKVHQDSSLVLVTAVEGDAFCEMQGAIKDLLAFEDRTGEQGSNASDGCTATDSDDSLEAYDLTEESPEGLH